MSHPYDMLDLDDLRQVGAHARLRHHERRELQALQLAVQAEHDPVARLFEARADQAYLDANAIATEHDITPTTDFH